MNYNAMMSVKKVKLEQFRRPPKPVNYEISVVFQRFLILSYLSHTYYFPLNTILSPIPWSHKLQTLKKFS